MAQKPMAKVWHQADRGGWFYMLDMNSPVGPFDSWVTAVDKLRDDLEDSEDSVTQVQPTIEA
jgi:hypothetical protein